MTRFVLLSALPVLAALPARAQAPSGDDDAPVLLAMSHLTRSAEARVEAHLRDAVAQWEGVRYRYGGTSRTGIDCSALMVVWFRTLFGIELPRTSREQAREGDPVPRSALRAGDLVYFGSGRTITHIGVYLGGGEFANSASSQGVSVASLSDEYWAGRYLGARRVLPFDLDELPDVPSFDFDLESFMDDAAAPFLEDLSLEESPALAPPVTSAPKAPATGTPAAAATTSARTTSRW
ncbi:MAG TPA: NlpC/P60 family protein [Rhodothermales bacterium]|nr:NlpC/P60 family protein [Rhodothermales bacterium]